MVQHRFERSRPISHLPVQHLFDCKIEIIKIQGCKISNYIAVYRMLNDIRTKCVLPGMQFNRLGVLQNAYCS